MKKEDLIKLKNQIDATSTLIEKLGDKYYMPELQENVARLDAALNTLINDCIERKEITLEEINS